MTQAAMRAAILAACQGRFLTIAELAAALQTQGHAVRERTVNRLLHDLGYSLQANRKTLETAARYSVEQGLTPRLIKLEEVFAPSAMEQ